MGRPSHPGPRPEPFAFPFAEARSARDSADEAADALALLRSVHEDAWAHVEDGGAEGRTAAALGARSRELLAALDAHVDGLRRQALAIDDDILEAERQVRIRDAAIADWQRAYRAWDAWEPPAPCEREPSPPPTVRSRPRW